MNSHQQENPKASAPETRTPAEEFLHNELLFAVQDAVTITKSQKRAIGRVFAELERVKQSEARLLATLKDSVKWDEAGNDSIHMRKRAIAAVEQEA